MEKRKRSRKKKKGKEELTQEYGLGELAPLLSKRHSNRQRGRVAGDVWTEEMGDRKRTAEIETKQASNVSEWV